MYRYLQLALRTKRLTMMLWISMLVFVGFGGAGAQRISSQCYGPDGRPRRCMPPFVNAAFNRPVMATNTCGLRGSQEYCLQTGVTGALKSCDICDSRDPYRKHPAAYLTDFNNNDNMTWWQSETMLEDVQYPTSVNLTLHLGKAFSITYIRLKFQSSRPESFAIYKKTSEDGSWIPYQYYSASCEETYTRQTRDIITRDDETKPICTDEYSDISPLTGGSVAFSTLEGRPSAYNFENSPVLQEWVTATSIKIVMNRMNTFGDEVFGDPNVLKSYFYAISDFAVGGRCKCNGHASECVPSTGQNLEETLVCLCQHNTDGPNCGRCKEDHNDRPWGRATPTDPHECQPCNCNGMSRRCYFDQALYEQTGQGGHCTDCQFNTAGPNCERCQDGFYRYSLQDRCQACSCDPVGSEDLQCDQNGMCRCKPGVTGEKCDRCQPNFYDFGPNGCRQCECLEAGSLGNNPVCLPDTGICSCKDNTEGQNCDRCKPGYFNLQLEDPQGCMSCFCYGHSSVCSSAQGFVKHVIHSRFDSGRGKWTGLDLDNSPIEIQYDGITGGIGISGGPNVYQAYFMAPGKFLGDQRLSYNQDLTFKLRLGEDQARASILDVVIEGNGLMISAPIYSQNNPVPRTVEESFKYKLHEHADNQWTPRLTGFEFQRMLSNISAIKIRGVYNPDGRGFLDDFELGTARQGNHGSEEANHVEQCECPEGYVGQFCESCAPGYHRDPPNSGPSARCIPCNCNGHSDICDVDTGKCICQHNTGGDNCEKCAAGWYGYALAGTEDDCQQCPCPDDGECVEMLDGEVVCINCKEGYTGSRCELCSDGYFGDPTGRYGPKRPCVRCDCNNNVDPNAVGNCNTTTGTCRKCIYNTEGTKCENCLPGHYGDPLSLPKGQCLPCDCHARGSEPTTSGEIECNLRDGQCPCLPNVIGRRCDACDPGHWNIESGIGCEQCRCDRVGSLNDSCDIQSGQCSCKRGVTGRQCDQCERYHYGFSFEGCGQCSCNPEGSVDLQCDERDGQCRCKVNIEGQRCDRCVENKYNITLGCLDCPPCYDLVMERVRIHRQKLAELREIVENVGKDPGSINDTDFRRRMNEVNESVNTLLNDARGAVGLDGPISGQLQELQNAIQQLMNDCGRIANSVGSARDTSYESQQDITTAERSIDEAERLLREAESFLETEGAEALRKAREAQDRAGQQSERMTEIAKEARELAERQEMDADRIYGTAENARNTSMTAYNLAREALRKPGDTADDINELRRDVTDAESLYETTKNMADQALRKAQEAYDDSLDIFSTAGSIVLPNVDVDVMKDDAQDIKDEAIQIQEEADRLLQQHRDLMEDVDMQKRDAEDMLENGIRQQQIADELLADADAARAIAREAVEKAEKTLDDADDTLDTLKEFDSKVQQSKDDAEDALERIPEIEARIEQAEDKTREAEQNLAGAEADAIMARDIAKEAENIAKMASDDASDIRNEADDTKDKASTLRTEADRLSGDVDQAETRLEDYEQQAIEDERLTKEALAKADQAKISADESSSKVGGALETVNDILRQLAGLDSIDTNKLDELERNLLDAEQSLIDANLDERYNALLSSRQQQNRWVRDYTDELIMLQKDVDNVRRINETIPRKCFGTITLEPTEPTG